MRVACIQLCSGVDRDANLERVATLLDEAAASGAELALLPENFSFMGGSQAQKRAAAEDAADSPTLRFLAAQASRHAMAIVGGSLLLRGAEGEGLLRNSAPVFDAGGHLLGLYDKIHLFDMNAEGERYCESALIETGSRPFSVPLGAFRLGVSICYDLRFPELYRRHAAAGCDLLCNVAAFTAATGRVRPGD
jgi:nitrilase